MIMFLREELAHETVHVESDYHRQIMIQHHQHYVDNI